MIIHNFDPVIVDFGFLQLRWYSVSYIAGILIGWYYLNKVISKLNTKNSLIIKYQYIDDFIIYLIIGIILGGRFGYVLFYDLNFFFKNPIEILLIWNGGMSFHGGLIGVILSSYFFSKNKKFNFLKLTDMLACATPIGLFFGRIANFINGELYGKATNVSWSVIFPKIDNISRHPSQIYEALLEGIVLFIIINFLSIKKKLIFKTGFTSSFFLIFYGLFRIISEIYREPDAHLGYFFNILSMGSILSIFMIASGFTIIFFLKDEK